MKQTLLTIILALCALAGTNTTAWAERVYELQVCEGLSGYIHVKGWSYDNADITAATAVAVRVCTDTACNNQYGDTHVTQTNNPKNEQLTDDFSDHGFDLYVPIGAGTYYVQVFGFDVNNQNPEQMNSPYTAVTVTAAEGITIPLTIATKDLTLHNGDVLTGTGGEKACVKIAAGATVTLSDVNITAIPNDDSHKWAGITCYGDATIVLADVTNNTVRGGNSSYPGIKVGPTGTTLTIQGGGSLNASGNMNFAAGIGSMLKTGSEVGDCGNIVIKGGNIKASGGVAPAIGSSQNTSCGNITIIGGTVNAESWGQGPGIGCYYSTCGDITITGGTVTAKSKTGPAIGSFRTNAICGNITITGGTVTAETSSATYSIGTVEGTCGTITIGNTVVEGITAKKFLYNSETTAYTVSFDKNNNYATGTMANEVFFSTAAQPLTTCTFSLAGNTFTGWNTAANGSGDAYSDGQTITATIGMTLYAQWHANVTVSFDANGGEGSMDDQKISYNKPQALTANTFTRERYHFAGWNTESNGSGTSYSDGQSITATNDVTLYAQWTPYTYNITYADAVNGTNYVTNTNPTTYAYMGGAITLAEPTRVGYTFNGWTYGEVTVPTKSVIITQGTYGDLSFTAHWTIDADAIITLKPEFGSYTMFNGQKLTGTGGANTHITIAHGATVTLSGVTITGHTNQWCPGITCEGDATIILDEGTTNTVAGGSGWSGIFVPQNKTLTIQGSGTLIANGSSVVGWEAAGIGGGASSASCGNIVITGGIITATGGGGSAGIGGGANSDCGNISITGGTVTANGGKYAPGIGSGYDYLSDCGDITITDGVTSITATKGANSPHSIGTAYEGSVGTITIGGVETGGIPQSPFTYNPTNTEPYTVTFDANGGVGTMDDETFTANTPQALTTNVFTRWSYDFTGWNTAADGSGVSFADGQKVINLGTATLYAQWQWVDLHEPDSPFGLLIKDETEAMGTAARWYINMPTSGTITQTFSDATITTFKVYDDGNGDYPGYYSNNCDGYLVLNAPEGYVIQLSGKICTFGYTEDHGKPRDDTGQDYLTVYDNSEASGTTLLDHVYHTYYWGDISTVTSSGKSMTLYFHSNGSYVEKGLDLTVTLIPPTLTLANNTDNTTAIDEADGKPRNVTLDGRTLYKDGDWNTLCLPFDLSAAQIAASDLAGAKLMELDNTETLYEGHKTGLEDGTLYLNFTDATSIKAGKPYIVKWILPNPDLTISTDAEWEAFAANVYNGTTYEGKIVKLAADINVTAMVSGTFKGTLDGDGHIINVSISGGGDGQALFHEINGATIMNVNVTGNIEGNERPATFASFVSGISTIRNCRSSVAISSTKENDWVDGGAFVARINSGHTINIVDCVFTGSVTYTTYAYAGGGIVGFAQNNSKANLTRCFYSPSAINISTKDVNSKTKYFVSGADNNTITQCYYNSVAAAKSNIFTNDGGTDASGMSNNDLLTALGDGWEIGGENVIPKKYYSSLPPIENPVFANVTINATAPTSVPFSGGAFVGQYSPFEVPEANRYIMLGSGNTLGYAAAGKTLRPFRAHFEVPVGNGGGVKAYQISFGDEGTETGIISIDNGKLTMDNGAGAWYDMSGRKLDGKPTQKGIYIHNGSKVVIK
ncbi:MAG: InlB B-repeat-containing protein [Bacteroidaceae bacterium]|nr:InlB B-repeat-containing protein [Bacteroidaceae bacterium]